MKKKKNASGILAVLLDPTRFPSIRLPIYVRIEKGRKDVSSEANGRQRRVSVGFGASTADASATRIGASLDIGCFGSVGATLGAAMGWE